MGEGEGRRRWISSVINGHDYLAKLAPLYASLFQPPATPSLPVCLSVSLFLSFGRRRRRQPRFTSSRARSLIIPTRAFSFYTCARCCLSYAWDPPTETMHPLPFFLSRSPLLSFSLPSRVAFRSVFFPRLFSLDSFIRVRCLSRQIVIMFITRNNLRVREQ